ncbi:MAG: cation transporter, partial [Treponemataceae bacterium]|nr:cation transporter [Treponemataceae bacterium]
MNMFSQDLKSHYIRVAGIIALLGNAALAATKLILGYLASSLAVMGDAIDSSTDVLIALVTI